MRTIQSEDITRAVAVAAIEANTVLPPDIYQALRTAYEKERLPRARYLLKVLLDNADIAKKEGLALCQDTGMVVVNIIIGQEVHIAGDLKEAVDEGVRLGYRQGHFRASVVKDPLIRVNTGDNTPCIMHTEIVPGDTVRITVFPKGAGSENMGRVAMLKPGAGEQGIVDFVVETVEVAGGNPCPPLVVGVGIGGNMELASYLAKKALMRPLGASGPYPELRHKLLESINKTGIGPQGLGGDTTALGVNIESFPTHIASLPVAVNLGCHSTRRCTREL
ncbi:MAG: fumarate hydratase [Syntrophomonadales bacterium]|jgi:fumarate hydratase subunit alpha